MPAFLCSISENHWTVFCYAVIKCSLFSVSMECLSQTSTSPLQTPILPGVLFSYVRHHGTCRDPHILLAFSSEQEPVLWEQVIHCLLQWMVAGKCLRLFNGAVSFSEGHCICICRPWKYWGHQVFVVIISWILAFQQVMTKFLAEILCALWIFFWDLFL